MQWKFEQKSFFNPAYHYYLRPYAGVALAGATL
jgi:hypothetical protein